MKHVQLDNFLEPTASEHVTKQTIQAEGQRVELPDASYVSESHMTRDGVDLVLETEDGTIIIEDYFVAMPPPALVAPDGTTLSANLVESFLKSSAEYADNTSSMMDVSPVGAVQEITGEATVTRVNGKVEVLGVGTPIYQGDIIETSEQGAVNIMFVDETTFAVSQDARLAIDEYVFDPSTNTGTSNFSVLKGVFVFTSGLIGREDPDDVTIETPSGSIGIRGTIIAGDVDKGEVTVIEGAIVLRDFTGNSVTLSDQYETGRFLTEKGEIEYIGKISAEEVTSKFMSVSTVASDLFSTINETANDDAPEGTTEKGASSEPEASGEEQQGRSEGESQSEGEAESGAMAADEDMMMSEDIMDIEPEAGESEDSDVDAQAEETTTGEDTNASGDGSDEYIPPETQEWAEEPFEISIQKLSFAENVAGVDVARLTAQNTDFAVIQLAGISENYFDITREDDTTFLISLKPGVAMDFEAQNALFFGATSPDFIGTYVGASTLNVSDVDEATILTNIEPNNVGADNFFSASDGNYWTYDFSESFFDPDGDIATYDLALAPSNPGIAWYNYDDATGFMEIQFDTGVDGSNFNIVVEARDSTSALLNTTTITFDTIDQTITGPFANLTGNNNVFSDFGTTSNLVTILSNNNNVFADGGDDTIIFTSGNNNEAMGGEGDDNFTLTSGNNNFLHGNGGEDVFTLLKMQNTDVYGGSENDTFTITAGAISDLETFSSNLVIDGGSDDFTNVTSNRGDILKLDTLAGNIDFSLIDAGLIENIETVKSDNSGVNVIDLDYNSVINMTDDDNILLIDTDSLDTVNFNANGRTFIELGTVDNSGETYNAYTDGTVTLLIDTEAANVTGL